MHANGSFVSCRGGPKRRECDRPRLANFQGVFSVVSTKHDHTHKIPGKQSGAAGGYHGFNGDSRPKRSTATLHLVTVKSIIGWTFEGSLGSNFERLQPGKQIRGKDPSCMFVSGRVLVPICYKPAISAQMRDDTCFDAYETCVYLMIWPISSPLKVGRRYN